MITDQTNIHVILRMKHPYDKCDIFIQWHHSAFEKTFEFCRIKRDKR